MKRSSRAIAAQTGVTMEISPTQYQVRFYEDTHPDNYVGSFQVFVSGNRGYIYSLMGRGFYLIIKNFILDLATKLQVESMEFYLMKSHYKLLKRALSDVLNVEKVCEGDCAGRRMIWTKLTMIK